MPKKSLVLYVVKFIVVYFGFNYFLQREVFAEKWPAILITSIVAGLFSGAVLYFLSKKNRKK